MSDSPPIVQTIVNTNLYVMLDKVIFPQFLNLDREFGQKLVSGSYLEGKCTVKSAAERSAKC